MDILSRAAGALWGPAGMAVFLLAGLYMTLCARGVQFRRLGESLSTAWRGFFIKRPESGSSPLEALSAALGGTVGTGNIAGVTLSIALGGPGVLFWMWVSAFIGMALKYAEVMLAVKYRVSDGKGGRLGGPMYYIVNGLGAKFRPLARLFALAGALAAFGMGCAVQSGEIRSALAGSAAALGLELGDGFPLACGIVTALAAAAVLLGGAVRLGRVASLLVPGMGLAYAGACAAVIAAHIDALLPCLGDIVGGAFRPEAGLAACMGWGIRRGVFSNEAGLGSSPIAHAQSSEKDCVRQAMAGVFEVFADTIVICTLTGLALLTSGVAGEPTTALNAAAAATVFGDRAAALVTALAMTLFAFSSLLTWGMYGGSCCAFLLGERSKRPYLCLFCLTAALAAPARLDAVWLAGDTLNALMAAPNLAALILLGGTVRRETDRYFKK